MKISVVIPTYDRSNTITRSIETVLNQTLSPFELIVVDDCSTDDTAEVVATLKDPRIRFFSQDKNSGAQVARNRGIIESAGDWIAFQDSDDEWIQNKLEEQVKVIKKVNYDPWTVVHCDCYIYDTSKNQKRLWHLPVIHGDDVYSDLLKTPAPMFQGILVSKLALQKINLLDENVPSYQEWDTSIRLAKHCTFFHIRQPLFIYYRNRSDTISNDKNREIDGYQYVIEKHHREIIRLCGQETWQHHLNVQLKNALSFGLKKHARYLIEKIENETGNKLISKRLCNTLGLKSGIFSKLDNKLRALSALKRRS